MAGQTRGKLAGNLLGNPFLQTFPERGDMFAKYKMVALTGELQVEEVSWLNNDALPKRISARRCPCLKHCRHLQGYHAGETPAAKAGILQPPAHRDRGERRVLDHFHDVDGTILTFNLAAERMLGYRADELVGKPRRRYSTMKKKSGTAPSP